jgi:glycine dehydrogenase subunit 1
MQARSPVFGSRLYNHYRPVVVDTIVSRGEFLTSYTPYQSEISQGTLTAIFEFQTMVCQLTGMEVANASMSDASTAVPEAALMAIRVTGRHRILIGNRCTRNTGKCCGHTRRTSIPVEEFGEDRG